MKARSAAKASDWREERRGEKPALRGRISEQKKNSQEWLFSPWSHTAKPTAETAVGNGGKQTVAPQPVSPAQTQLVAWFSVPVPGGSSTMSDELGQYNPLFHSGEAPFLLLCTMCHWQLLCMRSTETGVAWQESAPRESLQSSCKMRALKHTGTLEGAMLSRKMCRHLRTDWWQRIWKA